MSGAARRYPPLYRLSRRQFDQSTLVINTQGIHLGLVVYQAHQIQAYPQGQYLPLSPSAPKSPTESSSAITGYLAVDGQSPLPILDGEAIINSFRQ